MWWKRGLKLFAGCLPLAVLFLHHGSHRAGVRGRKLSRQNAVPKKTAQCSDILEGSLTGLEWYNSRNSTEFFRCLHDVRVADVLLQALYFKDAARPQPFTVSDEPGLPQVFLNPEAAIHHLLYKHVGELQEVVVQGTQLSGNQFPGSPDCGSSLARRCTVVEVSELLLCALPDLAEPHPKEGCQEKVSSLILDLQRQQMQVDKEMREGEVEPAYCNVALLLPPSHYRGKGYKGFAGYHEAQCALTSCGEPPDSKINYDRLHACWLEGNVQSTVLLFIVLLLYLFTLVGVVADSYLVPALVQIGRDLEMSDAMLGATLLALGGSITDFMAGLVSALAGEHSADDISLWLGGIVGAGLFACTGVMAIIMVVAGTGVPIQPQVFTRDVAFRSLANALLLTAAYLQVVSAVFAVVMIACYAWYVLLTVGDGRKQAEPQSRLSLSPPATNTLHEPRSSRTSDVSMGRGSRLSVSFQALAGGGLPQVMVTEANAETERCSERLKRHFGWPSGGVLEAINFVVALPFRPLFTLTMARTTWDSAVNPLLPVGMSIFIPFGNPFGNVYAYQGNGPRVTILAFWLLGAVCAVHVCRMSRAAPGKYVAATAFHWATFLTSLLWVGMIANEVLSLLSVLGEVLGLSPTTMGITMLALGNTVDNVFASFGLASSGEFIVAMTGTFAADTFTMLCVVGSILLMLNIKTHEEVAFLLSPCVIFLLGGLQVILAVIWVWVKMSGWKIHKSIGWTLAVAYPSMLALGFLADSYWAAQI